MMMNKGCTPGANGLQRAEALINGLCERGEGLVTFDADGVLWRIDSGDGFLRWQIENHRLTPAGEKQVREAWNAYLRAELNDAELAFLWAAGLEGLVVEELIADAQAFFVREVLPSVIQPVRDWARRLQEAGLELWIISCSPQHVIQAGARSLGLRDDRVLSVCPGVRNGRVTGQVTQPVTWGPGKAEAIRLHLRRVPQLAAGNTFFDRHMMELAEAAIAVEPDAQLEQLASERHWPIVRF